MLRRIPRPLALLLAVAALLTRRLDVHARAAAGARRAGALQLRAAPRGDRQASRRRRHGDHPDSSQCSPRSTSSTSISSPASPTPGRLVAARGAALRGRPSRTPARRARRTARARTRWPRTRRSTTPTRRSRTTSARSARSGTGSSSCGSRAGCCSSSTVTCAWLAAAELFARVWPRVIATGCVALLPQLTALSGTINADNLLVAVWSAFAVVALRTGAPRPGRRTGPRALRARRAPRCSPTGAASRSSGAAGRRAGRRAAPCAPARSRRRSRWLAPGVGVLLVGGRPIYRLLLAPSTGAYGGEVVLAPRRRHERSRASSTSRGSSTSRSCRSWTCASAPTTGTGRCSSSRSSAASRRSRSPTPGDVYDLIQGACAIGLAGLVLAVVRALDRGPRALGRGAGARRDRGLDDRAAAPRVLPLARGISNDPLITGRYVLPVVGGLRAHGGVRRRRRCGPRVGASSATLVLSGLLALNLAGLLLTLTRFYG